MIGAARTVVLFGVLLQLAGFVKLLIIASYFGAGPILDAYYLGLVIPTFVAGVSVGVWQAGLVPPYVSAKAHGDEAAARRLGGSAVTWTAVCLMGISLFLIVTQGLVLPLLERHVTTETAAALGSTFALLVWMLPLQGIADGGAFLLNAEGRFAAAASAPLLNALVGSAVLLSLGDRSISALTWSLLAGLLVQCLAIMLTMRRVGIDLRPRFLLPAAPSQLLTAVAIPVVLSVLLGNFVPAFIQAVSARGGEGAISAMGYAWRLNNVLIQAVVISVSAVLLPYFSRLVAQQKNAELRTGLVRVFAATLLFSLAAVVTVALGGEACVRILLERGSFGSQDSQLVAKVWLALTAGLFGATWSIFLSRLFQASGKLWLICLLGGISVATNVLCAYALVTIWGVIGVALANSMGYTLVMWLSHRRAAGTLGPLLSGEALMFTLRALLANGLAYAVGAWLLPSFLRPGSVSELACQLLLVTAANLLVARSAPLKLRIRTLLMAGSPDGS